MFIQWAIKGIYGGTPPSGIRDDGARAIIDGGFGILCNWWRRVREIDPPQCIQKLPHRNLAMHVNQYQAVDLQTNRSFSEDTPFISLAAGAVERAVFLQTNRIYPAKLTVLDFATQGGKHSLVLEDAMQEMPPIAQIPMLASLSVLEQRGGFRQDRYRQ